MKRMLSTILMLASASFATGHAAEKSDASAELARLPFPDGELACTGNLMPMGGKPGHATTGTAHVEKILGGNWIVIRYDEQASAENAKPYGVVQYVGYEDAGKRYVSTLVDNNEGSGYSTGVSPGWKDDAMTFDETLAGGKSVVFRDTFTANGDVFTHAGTMLDKNGKWVKTDEETCRKR
ncbi:MAG TPA: DUF1579 family protein [Rhodanobacteraceae bacterium]|nr:DUF1579 family protein [Rhodanobacteraceae bacterium]